MACLSAVAAVSCGDAAPTRVILFLADGAGNGHWTVARLQREDLAVASFAAHGLVDTRGADHVVTGSAPAATAYATGVRSRMRAIGLGPDLEPRTTVLEYAQQHGMATGLVTTTMLTDATPAAFATHYPKRDHLAVAQQMAKASVTVLLGGGRMMFARALVDGGSNVLEAMRSYYAYIETPEALDAVDPDTVTALLGLFAEEDLDPAPQRRPSLADMTATALRILDRDPDGFFLMVETEETDTQAHENAPFDEVAAEMLAFDDAIRVALEYRNRRPGTLVIVTSDHEAGGVSVHENVHGTLVLQYTTTGHTAGLVPIFADGPGAERFGGLIANDEVGRRLVRLVHGE
jgi:alkaline phosphatase